MQITINGKQLSVNEALRAHVESGLLSATEKYFPQSIEATVTLSPEGRQFTADIIAHPARGLSINGSGRGDTPEAAFDAAAGRIAKRLRRHKRRLDDHHQNPVEVAAEPVPHYVIEGGEAGADTAEVPDPPLVIAEMTVEIETLTVGEAVMRLDLGDLPAVMFRNRAHSGLNMIYRRSDGNIGWMDPDGNSAAR